MKDYIIAGVTLIGGFFLGKQQERWKNKTEIERQKALLFTLLQDLELRRDVDLKLINSAFSTVILVEKGLMDRKELLNIKFPRRIENKPIDEAFNSVISSFEFGFREGVRSLLVNIDAVNGHLEVIREKFGSEYVLTSDDLINIHAQMITYSYLVHQLNLCKERYTDNGIPSQELLEVAAKAFGVPYHIDEIVAERIKHITKQSTRC